MGCGTRSDERRLAKKCAKKTWAERLVAVDIFKVTTAVTMSVLVMYRSKQGWVLREHGKSVGLAKFLIRGKPRCHFCGKGIVNGV